MSTLWRVGALFPSPCGERDGGEFSPYPIAQRNSSSSSPRNVPGTVWMNPVIDRSQIVSGCPLPPGAIQPGWSLSIVTSGVSRVQLVAPGRHEKYASVMECVSTPSQLANARASEPSAGCPETYGALGGRNSAMVVGTPANGTDCQLGVAVEPQPEVAPELRTVGVIELGQRGLFSRADAIEQHAISRRHREPSTSFPLGR